MKYLTTNLNDFNDSQLESLKELLDARFDDGLPDDFGDVNTIPILNTISGNVFFTNSENQIAMINDDSGFLESFYTLPCSGIEGFVSDLIEAYNNCYIRDAEDIEMLIDICISNGYIADGNRIKYEMNY